MKIVIASDSFKGSLTSLEVGEAGRAGILAAYPEAEVIVVPVGDGGEGTAVALLHSTGGTEVRCTARDPLGRKIEAGYGIVCIDGTPTAVIDVAASCGLGLLEPRERDVMKASSAGVGDMIADALARGCRSFMIGLGGTATCDAGMGMLGALGVRFLDADGVTLAPSGRNLARVREIDLSRVDRELGNCRFMALNDVTSPLTGDKGAARMFAPQKGASPVDVEKLERGIMQFASIAGTLTGKDFIDYPGAGSAGGLGYAFLTFLKGLLRSGVDAVLDAVDFEAKTEGVDLVITGEGSIDRQTLQGKLPMGVCRRASSRGVPVVGIAGRVEDREELLRQGFADVVCIHGKPIPLAEAMRPEVSRAAIADTAARIVNLPILPRREKSLY